MAVSCDIKVHGVLSSWHYIIQVITFKLRCSSLLFIFGLFNISGSHINDVDKTLSIRHKNSATAEMMKNIRQHPKSVSGYHCWMDLFSDLGSSFSIYSSAPFFFCSPYFCKHLYHLLSVVSISKHASPPNNIIVAIMRESIYLYESIYTSIHQLIIFMRHCCIF
jgi:hypothetical protein